MKLYMFRLSQCRTIFEARDDGALRFVGDFDNSTQGDIKKIEEVKWIIETTAEMMDSHEEIAFVEVS